MASGDKKMCVVVGAPALFVYSTLALKNNPDSIFQLRKFYALFLQFFYLCLCVNIEAGDLSLKKKYKMMKQLLHSIIIIQMGVILFLNIYIYINVNPDVPMAQSKR